MKKVFLCSLLVLGVFQLAQAQPKKFLIDNIAAQVGDKIILRSDIFNAIADYKRQGGPVVPTQCEILESELVRKALVLQAQRDSLVVTDEEIEALLDNQVRGFINMYGSQQILEEIAGKTVYQIKDDFRPIFRERKLADQMRGKILDGIRVTPVEVKAYYDKIPKDSLAFYESELEINQVIVFPKPNRDVEEYVTNQLNDWKKQVEGGTKSFESLAKLYSQDPGVKENAGLYNLNRNDKGMWDPTFLSTAFRLKEGQISNVFRSKFGLHILQLVSRSGDDAVVRHILRIPNVTEDEIKEAKAKLDSIRVKVMGNQLSFGEAVNKYSDDENSKFNGGAIMNKQDGSNYLTIDVLDKDMVALLKGMKVGDVSAAQSFTDERGRAAVRIIFLKSRTEPHRENLKDDYDRVAKRVIEEKKELVMRKWFTDHIPSYYIRIDKDFADCSNLDQWRHTISIEGSAAN
ncbi:periplasmic chaperone for outer membrane proteins SurA [Filimonas lacunae]|uniref:Periplasmic chaperone for outer membrane proteins SurA n=1 Tax=Filimonas lacunae TaxID=477680 RepID=A0A173MPJ0_9BACT|nr:peptidylprolyl isomerase [Filimonas lacunae]BAV09377.1 peptidyl-prolyl cis-trans isomerase [Filimonas lacunae]SIS72065.1 periplasmic chaperone for outer membrane proteins SurA [Filimonas lacunae]